MTSRKHRPFHRKLAAHWNAAGTLTTCELRFAGCLGNYGLAPCHSKDRRDIHTYEDFAEVVAGCQKCHFTLDRETSKDERLRIVKEIIANRDEYYGA